MWDARRTGGSGRRAVLMNMRNLRELCAAPGRGRCDRMPDRCIGGGAALRRALRRGVPRVGGMGGATLVVGAALVATVAWVARVARVPVARRRTREALGRRCVAARRPVGRELPVARRTVPVVRIARRLVRVRRRRRVLPVDR